MELSREIAHLSVSTEGIAVTSIKKVRGFSLVEILVVLVIIGLLVSIVAPNVLQRADEARIQKVKADFKNIETALKLYKLDNFNYPTTEQGLMALVEKPSIDPIPRNWKQGGYLERAPEDPWGRLYKYLNPPEFGHGDYDLYSQGADGVSGGEDQNADIGNWQADQQEQK
jgi:general secretion pathway protein G